MFRRTRPLVSEVTISLDDEPLRAEQGEPLVVALLAADKLALARSPKLHRPRGPACLRGGCDGCLARVDGEPNVMTCLRPARGGERIETQNVIGSRKSDLLRVTDWFFPQGIDHHHLLAGIPGVSEVMQSFARKLAGLGRLPATPLGEQPARRIEADVVVIGGGRAGTAIARRLGRASRNVVLIDDSLGAAPAMAGVEVLRPATAAGVYLGEVLVVTESGAAVIRARARIFATGAHEGALAVPNNDLPGVMSARALCRLMDHGVAPDGPVVLVERRGPPDLWAAQVAGALGAQVVRVDEAELASIDGSSRVRGVVVARGESRHKHKAEVVAVATPPAPSFELAVQAGAQARHRDGIGYAVVVDERGRAGDGLWAAGECTGRPFDPPALEAEAAVVAADVEEYLARGGRHAVSESSGGVLR